MKIWGVKHLRLIYHRELAHILLTAGNHELMPLREYRDNTVSSTTTALENVTLGASAYSQPQTTARTGFGSVAPSRYLPLPTGSHQPIGRSSYGYSAPGSSQLANPGPYQSPDTGSDEPRRRPLANPGRIQGSSPQSGGEDEDEDEEEETKGKGKKVERGKGKGKKKRDLSGTPEAQPPKRRPYDPVRDA